MNKIHKIVCILIVGIIIIGISGAIYKYFTLKKEYKKQGFNLKK